METLHLEPVVAAVMFAGIRIGALLLFAPFFGSGAIPMPLKAGLTIALTALLYPAYGATQLQDGGLGWVAVVTGEVVVGLLLGLAVQFILEAVQTAGQILGVQAGYSLVTLLDPQTQADTPVMATFSQLVALLIFLQLDVHHWLLRALAASFSYLPPGRAVSNLTATTTLLQAAGSIWLVGFEIAAPVVLATLLADVTLGFLAKASPQLPVLFIGISLKNMLALTVLAGTLILWPRLLQHHFAAGISLGERLLHLAR